MSEILEHKFVEEVEPFRLVLPVFEIEADNNKIAEELSWCHKRLSDNPFFSHYEDFQIDFEKSPATKALCATIDEIATKNFSFTKRHLKTASRWAHIHKPLESTEPHNHKPCDVSFVYYVKAPKDCGSLAFLMDSGSNDRPAIVHPMEGRLIFFPSWIMHKVSKNMSDETRMSVSGNYG